MNYSGYNQFMRLDIPFVPSRGYECGQACASMMIKYFYPGFLPNFDEINKIIHHQPGKNTFPAQNVILLDHYGIKAKVFSSDSFSTTNEDPNIFHKWFGDEYAQQIKYVDIPSFNWMHKKARKLGLCENRQTSLANILELVKEKSLVSIVVDWHRLKNKHGSFQGHFVVISGFDSEDVFIHDPNEGPFIAYPYSQLDYAYRHPAITDDLFVAFGKK